MTPEEPIDLCSSQEDNFESLFDQVESPAKKLRVENNSNEITCLEDSNPHVASVSPHSKSSTSSYSDLQNSFVPPRKALFQDVASEKIEGLGGLLGVGMTRESANPLAHSNLDEAAHRAGLTPSTSIKALNDGELERELSNIFTNFPPDHERRVNEILEEQELRRLRSIYEKEKVEGKDTIEHIYSDSSIIKGPILPTKGSPSPKDKQKSVSPVSSSDDRSPQDSPYKSPLPTRQSIQNYNVNSSNNNSAQNVNYKISPPPLESIQKSQSTPTTPLKSYKNNDSSFTFTSPLQSKNSNTAPVTPSKISPKENTTVRTPGTPKTPGKDDPETVQQLRRAIFDVIANKPASMAKAPVPISPSSNHRKGYDEALKNEANKALYDNLKSRKETEAKYHQSIDRGHSHWENALWSYMKKVREHPYPITTFEEAAALTGGAKTRRVLKEIFGLKEGSKWVSGRIGSMKEFWDSLPKEKLPSPSEIHAKIPPNWGPGKVGQFFSAEKLLTGLNMLVKGKLIQVDDITPQNYQNIKWKINAVILSDKENENISYQCHINMNEGKIVLGSGCKCKGHRNSNWCKHTAALLFHLISTEEREIIIKACAESLTMSLRNLPTAITEISQQSFQPPSSNSNNNNNNSNNNFSPPKPQTPLNKTSPVISPLNSNGNSPQFNSSPLSKSSPNNLTSPTKQFNGVKEDSLQQSQVVRLDLDDNEPSYPSIPVGSPLVQKKEEIGSETFDGDNSIFDLETPPCSQNSPPTTFITEEARDSFSDNLSNSMDSIPSNSLGDSQGSFAEDSRERFFRLEKEKDEEPFPQVAASFDQFQVIMKDPKKLVPNWPPQSSSQSYFFKGNFSLSDEIYVQLGLHLFNPNGVAIPESVEHLKECLQWGYAKWNHFESMKPEIIIPDIKSSSCRVVVPKGRRGQAIAWMKRILLHSCCISDIEREAKRRCIGIDEESILRYHHMQFFRESEIEEMVKGVIGKDYALKLILDSNEYKKKEWAAKFQKNFRQFGQSLAVETRQLKHGDYAWLIQYPLHGIEHYQLEILVERKSSSDLKSTLADSRSFTQPEALGKLKNDGIDIIYIIEGSTSNTGLDPIYREFEKKLSDLGFKVAQSFGEIDTIHRLTNLTDHLWQKITQLIKKQ